MKHLTRLLVVALFLGGTAAQGKCVQIYYDRAPGEIPQFTFGRSSALAIQNLLGHFPAIQQYIIPVEKYEKGQIERCEATLYIGSFYDNKIPPPFLEDFTVTKKQVVWLGYNVWRLGEDRIKKIWNAKYNDIADADYKHKDKQGLPGFFRFHEYNGETFTKFAEVDKNGKLQAAFDIIVMSPLDPNNPRVRSWVTHSGTKERVPYILRAQNHWFFADVPISYIHEGDRYNIFADALFDILDEKPLYPNRRPALVRYEDVHPMIPSWQIKSIVDAAVKAGIKFNVSLIPVFKDPYFLETPPGGETEVPITKAPRFVQEMKDAQTKGGTMLLHGFTHQSDNYKNPDGISGLDWEFWDVVKQRPMAMDGAGYVISRLEKAIELLAKVGLKPAGWLTPHYQASLLDNAILAQLFKWNVGRIQYAPFERYQKKPLPENLTFDRSGPEQNGNRIPYFTDLKVQTVGKEQPAGQYFPYELYGDAYGTRLLPENIGYLRPKVPGSTVVVTVDDMIENMRRNRVIRDAWASMFVHPFIVGDHESGGIGETPGDNRKLVKLFTQAKALGYDFISVQEWAARADHPYRPEPIEVRIPAPPLHDLLTRLAVPAILERMIPLDSGDGTRLIRQPMRILEVPAQYRTHCHPIGPVKRAPAP